MADYYCRICNVRRVQTHDGVCANCQDPYQTDSFYSQADRGSPLIPSIEDDNDSASDNSVPISRSKRKIIGLTSHDPASHTVQKNETSQSEPLKATPVVPSRDTSSSTLQNSTTTSHNTSSRKSRAPQAEGVVRNIIEGKDPKGFLSRWFRSFSTGSSFPMTNDQLEFQVFSNWANSCNAQGYAADKVIVYGKIQSGKPVQDNTVRVYGKRSKNNAIIAEEIENTTDGTRAELDPPPIPAFVVTFVTLLVFGLIFVLITSVGGIVSNIGASITGVGNSVVGFASVIFSLVLWGLVTFYCVSKLFRLLTRNGDATNIIMYGFFTLLAMIMLKNSFLNLF